MKHLFILLLSFTLWSCADEQVAKSETSKSHQVSKELEKEAISYSNFNTSVDLVDYKLKEELYAQGYDSLELSLAIIQEERSNNQRVLHLNHIRKSMIQLEFFTKDKILNLMTICNLMLQEGATGVWMIENLENGTISFDLTQYPKDLAPQISVNYMQENELLFRSEMSALKRQMTAFCIPKDTLSLAAINTVFRNEETNDQFEALLTHSLSSLNSESQQAIVKNIITTLSVSVKVPEGNKLTNWVEYQFGGMTPDNATTYFVSLKTDIQLLKGAVLDYLVSQIDSEPTL
ncbi:MAG: hypothetical protein ACI9N1_002441 [Flavobacteriales bacterium]|jgi:hypothetical protein